MSSETLSRDIGADELRGHVSFLADPVMEGRAPRSRGSRQARQYIQSRFRSYGLRAWGQAKGFAQPFTFGTNVVGVLDGTGEDPDDGVILLCAHYDHVGKDKDGNVCPGAADNASGVAALLEIAEALSMSPQRPRRSIAFACFDCEEQWLLGAMAFACRKDFDLRRLAAVVNIDMLGRSAMNVMPKTLLTVGTEGRPALRQAVRQAAAGKDVQALLLDQALVGAVADHAAFISDNSCCLFFTSGYCQDYHKPADTADKLDYSAMADHAQVIREVVTSLEHSSIDQKAAPTDEELHEELQAVRQILMAMEDDPDRAQLSQDLRQQWPQLVVEASQCLESGAGASSQVRTKLQRALWQYSCDVVSPQAKLSEEQMLFLQLLSSETAAAMKCYRQAMRVVLKKRHKIALFGGKVKHRAVLRLPPPARVRPLDNARLGLDTILVKVSIPIVVSRRGIVVEGVEVAISCVVLEGTRDEIMDCLLLASCGGIPDSQLAPLIARVRPECTSRTPKQLLAERLADSACADPSRWIMELTRSPNPYVAMAALSASRSLPAAQQQQAVLTVLGNTDYPPWIKAATIGAVTGDMASEGLMILAQLLDDHRLYDQNAWVGMLSDPEHPCITPFIAGALKVAKFREKSRESDRAVCDLALARLKKLTGQALGKDRLAWQKWIQERRPVR
jgi:hypothetical protein